MKKAKKSIAFYEAIDFLLYEFEIRNSDSKKDRSIDEFRVNFVNFVSQMRNIFRDGLPYGVGVNAEIMMDDLVTHSHYLAPGNLRVGISQVFAKIL